MKKGYAILLGVLVVGAVALAVSSITMLLGIDATKNSLALIQGKQAKGLADACAEEGLQKIREATAFAGSGSLTLSTGTCTYLVTNTGGSTRTVTTTGTAGTTVRKVSISLNQINPTININTWQEVAN